MQEHQDIRLKTFSEYLLRTRYQNYLHQNTLKIMPEGSYLPIFKCFLKI